MDTSAAWHWHRRVAALVGWLAFGWVTVALLRSLSRSPEVPQILAYGLGLGLLAIALEAVWRRPAAPPPSAESQLRGLGRRGANRSEEHTSELQSLMRLSYAVFRLKK